MRAVLDTVVFVRALINPRGRWGRLLFECSDKYIIVISPAIIEEILEVIYRPELQKRFPQLPTPRVDRVIALFESGEVVERTQQLSVCRDPDDDKCFECAVEGEADYIVSEDLDILDVGEYEGIKAVTAEEFLRLFDDR